MDTGFFTDIITLQQERKTGEAENCDDDSCREQTAICQPIGVAELKAKTGVEREKQLDWFSIQQIKYQM